MLQNELVGTWLADPNDLETQQLYGSGASIEFKPNGDLIYNINEDGRLQVIFMTYEIVGNQLITNQPSMPNKETTVFKLNGNSLELNYEGAISLFIRV
ncbi:hypothetical protein [Chryseobacterium paludis]|uniref:hypothetical protein n=1 Tax=Chryseobacterium paludis TaxID=2956784 RepID=UPI0021BFCED0|nr:hypothetical protein [Chryseobacterium paludis]